MNTAQLRINGYAVTAEGHLDAHPGLAPRHDLTDQTPRFEQLRTAVIRIDITHGPRDAATLLVDKWLAAVDQPRALCGRKRDGSAILLFKHERAFPISSGVMGDTGTHELVTRDGAVKFTLTTKSEGVTVDVAAYSWGKNRSPLEIDRDRLPTLTLDVSKAAVDATWSVNCISESMFETQKRDETHIKELMAKTQPTSEERQAADDARLVDSTTGQDFSPRDGNFGVMVLKARRAVAARLRAKTQPNAAADREADQERRELAMLGLYPPT